MTNLLTVLGSAGGMLLLAVMAVVPVLLDLPQRRTAPAVTIPRQRGPMDLLPCVTDPPVSVTRTG